MNRQAHRREIRVHGFAAGHDTEFGRGILDHSGVKADFTDAYPFPQPGAAAGADAGAGGIRSIDPVRAKRRQREVATRLTPQCGVYRKTADLDSRLRAQINLPSAQFIPAPIGERLGTAGERRCRARVAVGAQTELPTGRDGQRRGGRRDGTEPADNGLFTRVIGRTRTSGIRLGAQVHPGGGLRRTTRQCPGRDQNQDRDDTFFFPSVQHPQPPDITQLASNPQPEFTNALPPFRLRFRPFPFYQAAHRNLTKISPTTPVP